MRPFPKLIFNMLYDFCQLPYYPLRLSMWLTVVMEKIDSWAVFLAHRKDSWCGSRGSMPWAWLKEGLAKMLLLQELWAGGHERYSMAYSHKCYLQL